ncbi:MAG: 3-deoxy-manno-octulosonate cytidylyltransferase, partial [Calditrichaeota bacterium]
FGGEVAMTPSEISTGSERVGYLVKDKDVDIVVNLQGDEPLISTNAISKAIHFLKENREVHVCTLGCPLRTEAEWKNPSVVKVVLDKYHQAIYFSRSPIPYFRDTQFNMLASVQRHIGVYIYRKPFLMQYLQWEPGILEEQEKLEQLRILEHGEKIQVISTRECSPGVDTPEDIPIVESLLKQRSIIS